MSREALEAIKLKLEEIVVPDGIDSGVILLSWDSPTNYDPVAKCQVYQFENFSPLGDALVALHGMICAAIQQQETP